MEQEKKRRSPVSDPLLEAISLRIRRGEFRAGMKMPSLRTLAQEYAVSLSTVTGVMGELCRRGVLVSQSKRGFFVTGEALEQQKIALLYYFHGIATPKVQMIRAIQKELTRQGKPFFSHDVQVSPIDANYIARNYSAVIAACYDDVDQDNLYRKLIRCNLPMVIACAENMPDVPGSYIDHYTRVYDTVRMLYDMGHRRIGMTVWGPERYFYPDAIRGYRDFLKSTEVPYDETLIQGLGDRGDLGSYLIAKHFFELPSPPTAVILGRDSHGRGFFTYCEEHGIVFGRDISVIGYDDHSWPAGQSFLSSITEPWEELGLAAAEIICDILNGVDSPRRREVPWHYRLRQSVAPLRINPILRRESGKKLS